MNWKTLLLVAALFAGALLAGRYLGTSGPDDTYRRLAPVACEPELGSCSYPTEYKRKVEFSLEPKENIRPLEPLTASVSYSGDGMAAIAVTLTGLNMDMGHNRFLFRRSGNTYVANVMLPVCTISRMEWEALVEMELDGERLALPFRFVIERK